MRYRTLGRSNIRVSEVGFGAWAIGGNEHGNSYGPTKDEESDAAGRRAGDPRRHVFATVDVYQLHNPPGDVVVDMRVQRLMEKLKPENKVRLFSISVHEPEEAVEAIESGRAVVVQIPFSLLRQEWIADIFPLARRRGVGGIA